MEQANEDQSLPRKTPRSVYPPVLLKKSPKSKSSSDYHLIEKRITNAITDFKAGKYSSLAEAGRAHEITQRAGYFRLRARAAGRASKSDRLKNGSQRLSPEQEIVLCQFVDQLDDVRALHRRIGEKAYSMLCEKLTADDPMPRPLGKQWPARFLERHPGIMARRPKPLTSLRSEESDTETSSSIPVEEARTNVISNEEPQVLLDCQRFLEGPTNADATASEALTISTTPMDPSLVVTDVMSGIENDISSRTATPPDPPNPIRSSINFFAAIKSSLAEQKMTFSRHDT